MYIGDTMGRREIYSPDALAIVDSGKTPHWQFTYRQMNERANRLANWLRDAAGVGQGDRVGIVARDGVEFLDAFFACGKLGAALACYNWRLHWRELLGAGRKLDAQGADLLRGVRGQRGAGQSRSAVPDAPAAHRRRRARGQPALRDDAAKCPGGSCDDRNA